MIDKQNTKIAIIGLGYVGLPLAVEFGKYFKTIGFDISASRIQELQVGNDSTLEVMPDELQEAKKLTYTKNTKDIQNCNIFIVTVPTPIDEHKKPDLTPLIKASISVGKALKKDDIIIYESTVFPGATEEICVPILEQNSDLKFNKDFFCGYSPERINPGDKEHRLTNIKKITSGSTPETANKVNALYKRIITAGTYKTSSIKVAEAAKVIENTQRDVNIALINELALIFNKLGIINHNTMLYYLDYAVKWLAISLDIQFEHWNGGPIYDGLYTSLQPNQNLDVWITEYDFEPENGKREWVGTWPHAMAFLYKTLRYMEEVPNIKLLSPNNLIGYAGSYRLLDTYSCLEGMCNIDPNESAISCYYQEDAELHLHESQDLALSDLVHHNSNKA